jgi:hypothetical protein
MNKRMIFRTPAEAVRFELRPRGPEAKPGVPIDGSAQLPMLIGYPIVWNATSSLREDEDTGELFYARMAPGSAKFTSPTRALYAHDETQLLGTTDNGTLRILPDEIGTRIEVDLPPTSYARDVAALITGKYVKGMSFGVTPLKWDTSTEPGDDGSDRTIRTYTDMIVDEVTVTGIPAFAQTQIDAMYERGGGPTQRLTQELNLQQLILDMLRW